jgi:hypothetical protein
MSEQKIIVEDEDRDEYGFNAEEREALSRLPLAPERVPNQEGFYPDEEALKEAVDRANERCGCKPSPSDMARACYTISLGAESGMFANIAREEYHKIMAARKGRAS